MVCACSHGNKLKGEEKDMKSIKTIIAACILALALCASAQAANFSFTGNFVYDDDVQTFGFSVGAPSDVTFRTYSYAGGTMADGTIISAGGFDPILALFDSAGNFIGQNDDGSSSQVPADPTTGSYYDTYLEVSDLGVGSYTVAVMQYDNFANGPNLSDGFQRDGQQNFTLDYAAGGTGYFWDVNADQRTSDWAFDILNVAEATQIPQVPVPAAAWLLGSGLLGLMSIRRKIRK